MTQSLTQDPHEARPSATPSSARRIAFVQACWHKDIVDRARDAFLDTLEEKGLSRRDVDIYEVPGSLEIPLQANFLAKSGRYAVIVAAGLVVDGGIYRHDFVAGTVIDAMMRVQLDTEVPILSVVLTPQHFHDHDEHQNFFREHFLVKGAEAANACIMTLRNLDQIQGLAEAS